MILNFEAKIKRNDVVFDTEKELRFTPKKEMEGVLGIENFAYENIGYVRFHAYNLDLLGFDCNSGVFENANNKELKDIMKRNSESSMYYQIFEKGFDLVKSNNCSRDLRTTNYLITLDRIYIDNRYRNKGVGTYIYQNLLKLLHIYFDIEPTYIVGVVIPTFPEGTDLIHKNLLEKEGFELFEVHDIMGFYKKVGSI